MLRTFNCGVGYCLIVNKKQVNIVKDIFKIILFLILLDALKEKKEKYHLKAN